MQVGGNEYRLPLLYFHPVPKFQRLIEPGRIDLDPSSLRRASPIRPRESPRVPRHRDFPSESYADPEIQDSARVEGSHRRGPDGDGNLGPRPAGPPVRNAHEHPAFLEKRQFAKEAVGLGGTPGERLIDVPRVEELPHQRTPFGGQGNRREELEERPSVAFPGELLRALGRGAGSVLFRTLQARRVGGQKGEGKLGVLLVLREVETDAPNLPPERRAFGQKVSSPPAASVSPSSQASREAHRPWRHSGARYFAPSIRGAASAILPASSKASGPRGSKTAWPMGL